MAAIRCEAQARHQFRVAIHGGHTLPRVVVIYTHVLVCTAGGCIDPTLVQHNLHGAKERKAMVRYKVVKNSVWSGEMCVLYFEESSLKTKIKGGL